MNQGRNNNANVREDFVKNNVYSNTVPIEEALVLDETLEVDGVRKYAGLKIAPKMVISPMSREEMIMQFGERGVPIKYYNHIKRLSDHRQDQMRSHKGHKFVSVNVYDDHMERDTAKTEKMRSKLESEGYSILDTGNF